MNHQTGLGGVFYSCFPIYMTWIFILEVSGQLRRWGCRLTGVDKPSMCFNASFEMTSIPGRGITWMEYVRACSHFLSGGNRVGHAISSREESKRGKKNLESFLFFLILCSAYAWYAGWSLVNFTSIFELLSYYGVSTIFFEKNFQFSSLLCFIATPFLRE